MESQEWGAGNLLTPAEVAAIFRVDPKTVAGWARCGKLRAVRTLGGHRRYLKSEVLQLVHGETPESGGQI
jgi:excisionase family DNA binding protein